MAGKPTTETSAHLGVLEEARITDERQNQVEEESRRYSTMVPLGNIEARGQFLRKISQRRFPVWAIVVLWIVCGLPLLALLVAGVLAALAKPTIAERLWGIAGACVYPAVSLLALAGLTRNWLQVRGR